MTYADGFVSVRHSFLIDPGYTAVEKLVLVWLASKPADWNVRQDQVCRELNLGREAVETALKHLRATGAITPTVRKHGPGGKWVTVEYGHVAIRDKIRHVSAGRTALRQTGTRFPVVHTKESRTNEGTTTKPAEAGRSATEDSDSAGASSSSSAGVAAGFGRSNDDDAANSPSLVRVTAGNFSTSAENDYLCPYCDGIDEPDHLCKYLRNSYCERCIEPHSPARGCKVRRKPVIKPGEENPWAA